MNERAALQNGARASAIKPKNKGHSKNSRAEAGKGTYTQFEPARTHTQLYNLNVYMYMQFHSGDAPIGSMTDYISTAPLRMCADQSR